MILERGDVILVDFPYVDRIGSKVRPALVVQNDRNNTRLTNVIVAPITTTRHRSGEPTQLLIESTTSHVGRLSGLLRPSVIACENVTTLAQHAVIKKIGFLPDDAMQQINACLKAALGIS